MPVDMKPYGTDWPAFSRQIRFVRARSQCECFGQCGLHRSDRERRRCKELHHRPALYAKGTIRLTVAHLCSCTPPCRDANHVIAACQRCHLRIDRYKHARTRYAARHGVPEPAPVRSPVPSSLNYRAAPPGGNPHSGGGEGGTRKEASRDAD